MLDEPALNDLLLKKRLGLQRCAKSLSICRRCWASTSGGPAPMIKTGRKSVRERASRPCWAACVKAHRHLISRRSGTANVVHGLRWCGRAGSNRHGQCPTDFRTTSTFVAANGRSWSGLSLRRSPKALDAARLVSTPSRPKSGLARDRHLTGFPDFERFYVQGFPRRTQSSA